MTAKPCPACTHPERQTIDRALAIGQAPRSIIRRYRGLNPGAPSRPTATSATTSQRGRG